jgi:EAL domain-containing protein (putative c-di-GMP-specific phosphodiesterase class I)
MVATVRQAGGRVAVDDAGAGYASLRHILELRPDFVKLDRSLVAAVDRDPAIIAVVQMLGDFTSRLDSWLIAEGIERLEEMDVLASLGVPLGQGYLLGRPEGPWADVPAAIGDQIRERAAALTPEPAAFGAEAVARSSSGDPASLTIAA